VDAAELTVCTFHRQTETPERVEVEKDVHRVEV
jgi:hypothetical protein